MRTKEQIIERMHDVIAEMTAMEKGWAPMDRYVYGALRSERVQLIAEARKLVKEEA